MKKRTAEEMREYQRKRRASIKAWKTEEPIVEAVTPDVPAVSSWGTNRREPGALLKRKP